MLQFISNIRRETTQETTVYWYVFGTLLVWINPSLSEANYLEWISQWTSE